MTAYLYRLFDDAGRVVRRGVTENLADTLAAHEAKLGPARFVTWQAEPYPTRDAARDALLPARKSKRVAL